jgi:hypothetical protein
LHSANVDWHVRNLPHGECKSDEAGEVTGNELRKSVWAELQEIGVDKIREKPSLFQTGSHRKDTDGGVHRQNGILACGNICERYLHSVSVIAHET